MSHIKSFLPNEAIKTVVDNLPSMIGYWDKDLRNRFVNKAYEDWFSVDAKKITGKHIREVIGDNLYNLNLPYIEAVLQGYFQEFERSIPNQNGNGYRHSLANYIPDVRDGEVQGFIALVTDITSLKDTEFQLKLSEDRYRAIVEGQTEVISRFYADGRYIFINEAYSKFFGKSPDEVVGKKWQPVVHPDDVDRVISELTTMSATNPIVMIENRVFSADGHIHWMQFCNRGFYDSDDQLIEIQSVGRDVTKRKSMEQQIERLAFYDLLTGLPNRTYFLDQLNLAISRAARSKQYSACLFLDLDNFKSVNDTHGHDYGDMLLIEVATRIKSNLRSTDLVGRFGGDEFIIVMESLNENAEIAKAEVLLLTEKVRGQLSEPFSINEFEFNISVSIGVSMFNDHLKSTKDLLKEADTAMYEAKRLGKNRICVFDASVQNTQEKNH